MLSILTLNLRYQNPADGVNDFEHRTDVILDCLYREAPDLIGFQEMTDDMLCIMSSAMQEYTFIGYGRSKNRQGEHCSIAYRTQRFTIHSAGTIWLSETPDVPGSRFCGQGTIPRICTWAVLEYLPADVRIAHYNTHLDHEFGKIRELELDTILKHIKAVSEAQSIPVFLSGDFNMTPEDPLYQKILGFEPLKLTDLTSCIAQTYHGFGKGSPKKIDYIFTDKKTAQGKFSVRLIRENTDGIYLSDHDGIRVDCDL